MMSSKRIEAFALLTLLLLMVLACISETTMAENPPVAEGAARVVVETSLGNFIIGLHEEQSPVTVTNFLSYVNTQHFDRTVFHRVIPGFMIQGGGFVHQGNQFVRNEVRPPIILESNNGLKNYRGAVSMARTQMPNSASDQFFINLDHNKFLDSSDIESGYAVFGVVLEGMDVVDAIAAVDTHRIPPFPEPATPVEDVLILSVRFQR
jgi:cyclophilin family peptidyl-prolyl cis-trans isomerase